MEYGVLWVIIAIIAAYQAAKASGRGVRNSYRQRRDTWAAAHPDAHPMAARAAATGHLLATARYGGPAAVAGWRQGWREGMSIGRDWAEQHRPPNPVRQPRPNPAVDALGQPRPGPAPEAPAAPAAPGATDGVVRPCDGTYCPGCPECKPPTYAWACPRCGKGGGGFPSEAAAQAGADKHPCTPAADADNVVPMRRRPSPQPQPTGTNNQQGSNDMAVQTATGGDVHNAEANLAEANSVVEEYVADAQDAAGDAARAQEDLKRLESWAASMKAAQAPSEMVAQVEKLKDPAQQRLAAAESRKAAADTALALANAVKESAAKDAQLIGRAVGSWYGN